MKYNEFLEYVKKNGITLARTTVEWNNIPKGTKIYFGVDENMLNSLPQHVNCRNNQFNYSFDVEWKANWVARNKTVNGYQGEFIVGEEYPCEDYEWLKVGDLVDISEKLSNYADVMGWAGTARGIIGKKCLMIANIDHGSYEIEGRDICVPAIYVKKHVEEYCDCNICLNCGKKLK